MKGRERDGVNDRERKMEREETADRDRTGEEREAVRQGNPVLFTDMRWSRYHSCTNHTYITALAG